MNPTKEDIETQLNKIFDNLSSVYATTVSYILSLLDLNLEEIKQFSKESIVKLYLFKRIKGFHRFEQLEAYFSKNTREAFLLGFTKDINNNLIFPKKRTFNEYLEEFDRNNLDKIAELIITVATKRKKLLDLSIVKKAITKKIDNRKELREATKLIKKLKENNIESRPLFYPIHIMPPYKTKESFPVAEKLSKKGLSLPFSTKLTEEQIYRIVNCIK